MFQLFPYQPQSSFGFLNSAVSLSSTTVWFILALIGVAFIVISSILSYHWKKYGFETAIMAKAATIYFSVAGALLGMMVVALMVYLGSI